MAIVEGGSPLCLCGVHVHVMGGGMLVRDMKPHSSCQPAKSSFHWLDCIVLVCSTPRSDIYERFGPLQSLTAQVESRLSSQSRDPQHR